MVETQQLRVIRLWAALAWADGTLAPAEAAALRKLIDDAKLAPAERAHAEGFLTTKTDVGPVELAGYSVETRQGIYRAACQIAIVDADIDPSEYKLLVSLRERLDLGPAVARQIEREVVAEVRARFVHAKP